MVIQAWCNCVRVAAVVGMLLVVLQGGKEEAVVKLLKEMDQPNVVAQHYLTKPLLVNGYKFDMRIYALVRQQGPGNMATMDCR
jgi:hypothetical protein